MLRPYKEELYKMKIISRKSNLALKQVEEIAKQINIDYELITKDSFGDKNKQISLLDSKTADDFFTRELDQMLLDNQADIAIHSAKDLPCQLPDGLEVIALTKRLDPADVFLSKNKIALNKARRVGLSSERRRAQVLQTNHKAEIVSIRGTIEERINLIEKENLDGIIVAACALKRLGLTNLITEILPFKTHPLQGMLAVAAKKNRTDLQEIFSKIDNRKNYGKVYLVGAGPGDPELMTIKAHKLIKEADVVLYDDLIYKNILADINAELVYVGKRKGFEAKTQEEINYLLYENAINGKKVVRLKGGDPFIFGRGGEEFDFLNQAFVECEVVPGITSAIAASAFLKLPLTKRGVSDSVTFLSGHSSDIEKIKVPKEGAIVYYMAGSNLENLAKRLIDCGRDKNQRVVLAKSVSSLRSRWVTQT